MNTITNTGSPCEHSERIINYTPVNNDSDIYININDLVCALPHELLVKIYNEYFRPLKFYQMYDDITKDTIYNSTPMYVLNKELFVRHLHIFLFGNIGKYIKRKDPIFEQLLYELQKRGYTSIFRLVPEIKQSIFMELLMCKYH